MRVIFVLFGLITACIAEIGDEESIRDALSTSHIIQGQNEEDGMRMATCFSAFDLKRNEVEQKLPDVHPLLRFMATCLASANQDLINLALHIKDSYSQDKGFIHRVFGFDWGTHAGNEKERDIYRVVEFAERKRDNSTRILTPQAVSFMLQYKVTQTLGMLGTHIDYIDSSSIQRYNLWIATAWPNFFKEQDKADMTSFVDLADAKGFGHIVFYDPPFFEEEAKKNPDLVLAVCDNNSDAAEPMLLSLYIEAKEQKDKQAREDFLRQETELRTQLLIDEKEMHDINTRWERGEKEHIIRPPQYTEVKGTQANSSIANGEKVAQIAAAYLFTQHPSNPMIIDSFVGRAARSGNAQGLATLSGLSANSVDDAVDYLDQQNTPTAVVLKQGDEHAAIVKGADNTIRFYTPKGLDNKATVMTFGSAADAKKLLRQQGLSTTGCTFYNYNTPTKPK